MRSVRFWLFLVLVAGVFYIGMRYNNALHRHDGLWVRDTVMDGRERACQQSQHGTIAPGVMQIRGTRVAFEDSTCRGSWFYPLRDRIGQVMGWNSKMAYRAVAFTCQGRGEGATPNMVYFSLDSQGGRLQSTSYLFDGVSRSGQSNGPFDGSIWETYPKDFTPIRAHASYMRCAETQ